MEPPACQSFFAVPGLGFAESLSPDSELSDFLFSVILAAVSFHVYSPGVSCLKKDGACNFPTGSR